MTPQARSKFEPIQPTSVLPLGIWLREGQIIEHAPRWDFKAIRNVYSRGTVAHVHAGTVTIKSGAIAAGDPLVLNARPFTRKVKPGKYPVTLSKLVTGANETITAASVILRAGTLERFELARVNSKARFLQSYAVDSAIGSFHDPKALPLIERYQEEHGQEKLWGLLGQGGSLALDKNGLNVVGFESGYGDGAYHSYWGLDAKGQALCLTTDFEVIASFESLDRYESYRHLEVRVVRKAKSA